MSQFCPDCGAQYEIGDDVCRECGFPLELKVTASSDSVTISGREVEKWKRLSALLRRGGMRITTRKSGAASTNAIWWTLPGLGVVILLASIFVGGPIIDLIWPPPTYENIPVVDLNAPRNDTSGEGEVDGEDDFDDIEESVSSLARALETTEEQRIWTNDQNLDFGDVVDRIEVSREEVLDNARRALLRLEVDDKIARATLLDETGFFLMESSLNDGAFRRETRTISRRGVLQDELIYIVPKVGLSGEEVVEARRIRTSPNLVLELMRANIPTRGSVPSEYERQLEMRDPLWVADFASGEVVIQKVAIVGKTDSDDIEHWVVEGDFNRRDSGNPVFDITGKLTGVLVPFQGDLTVVSLRTIRERAPLIFKELQ